MNAIRNPLVTLASAVIIVAGMHVAASIVNIILMAFLFAMSLTPLMGWAIRKGVKPALAVTITIVVVILGGLFLSFVVGGSISKMIDQLPTYQPRLVEIRDSFIRLLGGFGINTGSFALGSALEPQRILEMAAGFLSAGLGVVSMSLVILLVMVFILIEAAGSIAKAQRGEEVHGIMAKYILFGKEVRKYVSIVSLSGLFVAVGNIILLLVLGVDYPVLWGVLSFMLNFVPNLGFLLSVLPPALLALIQFGWQKALVVFVGFFLINALSENVIKTRFMAKGFDVPLLLVIISLLVWTWALGPMGTILGVPLTLVLHRMYKESIKEEPAGEKT